MIAQLLFSFSLFLDVFRFIALSVPGNTGICCSSRVSFLSLEKQKLIGRIDGYK